MKDAALELLKSKTNRIILVNKGVKLAANTVRTANGFLVQERDSLTETAGMLKTVTDKAPTENQTADLLFAARL